MRPLCDKIFVFIGGRLCLYARGWHSSGVLRMPRTRCGQGPGRNAYTLAAAVPESFGKAAVVYHTGAGGNFAPVQSARFSFGNTIRRQKTGQKEVREKCPARKF